MKRFSTILALILLAAPLWALDPSEKLDDPALEAEARELDHALRCVQCQSESLASSNAAWARDARRQIRELVSAGQSPQEVKDWFVARYGEFVLMDPPKDGANLVLWLAAPTLLLLAGLGAIGYVRNRAAAEEETPPLDPEEAARLEKILKE